MSAEIWIQTGEGKQLRIPEFNADAISLSENGDSPQPDLPLRRAHSGFLLRRGALAARGAVRGGPGRHAA